jgi:hypothetical protein
VSFSPGGDAAPTGAAVRGALDNPVSSGNRVAAADAAATAFAAPRVSSIVAALIGLKT